MSILSTILFIASFSTMGNSGSTCNEASFRTCVPFCSGCENSKAVLSKRFDKILSQHAECDSERKQFKDDWVTCTKSMVELEKRSAAPIAGEEHNSKMLAKVSRTNLSI